MHNPAKFQCGGLLLTTTQQHVKRKPHIPIESKGKSADGQQGGKGNDKGAQKPEPLNKPEPNPKPKPNPKPAPKPKPKAEAKAAVVPGLSGVGLRSVVYAAKEVGGRSEPSDSDQGSELSEVGQALSSDSSEALENQFNGSSQLEELEDIVRETAEQAPNRAPLWHLVLDAVESVEYAVWSPGLDVITHALALLSVRVVQP